MTGLGTAALAEGGRVDFDRLRVERRRRLIDGMDEAGVDVLVLGQGPNVIYASGYRPLWTAGSRPFAPSCVVFRSDERIHLLSTWDEGVPADIDRSRLFGLSWNPKVAAERLSAVPGLADARRIGVDGTSSSFSALVSRLAPSAEVVDARDLLRTARGVKTVDELACIETACAVAEAGLEAMVVQCRPGTTERQLLGVAAAQLAKMGLPITQNEAVASVTTHASATGPRQVVGDRAIGPGDVVALSPSAQYAGYEGTIARTVVAGDDSGATGRDRCRAGLDAVIERCSPGATGAGLLEVWRDAGGGPMQLPLVTGVGLGAEPPVIGLGCGSDAVLHAGQTLVVQGWLTDGGAGWLTREVVQVEADGPRLLTRSRRP